MILNHVKSRHAYLRSLKGFCTIAQGWHAQRDYPGNPAYLKQPTLKGLGSKFGILHNPFRICFVLRYAFPGVVTQSVTTPGYDTESRWDSD
jgi:hypothetical protein